jgi:CRP/FNR family transcriptional regulator
MTKQAGPCTGSERRVTIGAAAALSSLDILNRSASSRCGDCLVRERAFCASAAPGSLPELLRHQHVSVRDAYTTLFLQEDVADAVYIVRYGAIRLVKLTPDGRRQVLGFALPGDIVGLVHEKHHAFSAETIVETGLCALSRADIEQVVRTDPGLMRRLYAISAQSLSHAYAQMLLLGRKTALEKVASFLLHLSERQVEAGLPASPIYLPMSGMDIADHLGLRVETVSRCLTRLRSMGLVGATREQRIDIMMPAELRAKAMFPR